MTDVVVLLDDGRVADRVRYECCLKMRSTLSSSHAFRFGSCFFITHVCLRQPFSRCTESVKPSTLQSTSELIGKEMWILRKTLCFIMTHQFVVRRSVVERGRSVASISHGRRRAAMATIPAAIALKRLLADRIVKEVGFGLEYQVTFFCT